MKDKMKDQNETQEQTQDQTQSRYTVVENTPGFLPDDDSPYVGTWEDCCSVMDDLIRELLEEGYEVVRNEGCGFRLSGGSRQTYLRRPDGMDIGRVIEVMEMI